MYQKILPPHAFLCPEDEHVRVGVHSAPSCDGYPRSSNRAALPWQNGHAERLLGSIRRECLDHVVVFGEAHLRRVLKAYAGYYNEVRTIFRVGKEAPAFRASPSIGRIVAMPVLGGLHHQYVRV